MKLVGYQQPTCLCVMMEFVVITISLSCELCSLSKAAFVHMRPAQLCTENGISIYMCSAVEVAQLAQNIRHSVCDCVIASTVAFRCMLGLIGLIIAT